MGAYEKMFKTIPTHLKVSEYFRELLASSGSGIDEATEAAKALTNQFFVSLADYGLALWEEYLGLPINPPARTLIERRERITSKLRGSGTSTLEMLKRVAESYAKGDVLITEQNELYQFTIKFISDFGVPTQIDDLKRAIDEAKPAHLAVVYVYTFITYGQLAVKTHAQLAAFTHEQLRIEGGVLE